MFALYRANPALISVEIGRTGGREREKDICINYRIIIVFICKLHARARAHAHAFDYCVDYVIFKRETLCLKTTSVSGKNKYLKHF